MSFQFDTLHISHQLTTGIGYPYCFGLREKVIRGSVYFDGPTITGDETTFKTVEGSVMIGPCNNTDSPVPKVCENIEFCSEWKISGGACGAFGLGAERGSILYDPYSLVVRKGNHFTRDISCSVDGAGPGPTKITPSNSAALFIGDVDIHGNTRINEQLSVCQKADFNKDVIVRQDVIADNIYTKGDICAGETLDGTPVGRLLARIVLADQRPKPFDMIHPSLGEGHRLRYACIEGPEVGVYFRGRIKNETEIKLPWYWKDLVHLESITVQLQPIGVHQDIIVDRWDFEKIYLQSKEGISIDCFYHVYAERKDVNALIVEYDGNEHTDYPDTDYDDPQFSNRINTKTL